MTQSFPQNREKKKKKKIFPLITAGVREYMALQLYITFMFMYGLAFLYKI